MMKSHFAAFAALGFVLAACAAAPPAAVTADGHKKLEAGKNADAIPRPPVDGIDTADACGAAKLSGFIGKPVKTPGVPAEGPGVRHIYPDTIITMDFRADRLDIELAKDGTILKARCG